MQASRTHSTTPVKGVATYFIAGSLTAHRALPGTIVRIYRAFDASQPGPFVCTLGPVAGLPSKEAVRAWMHAHFPRMTEVER